MYVRTCVCTYVQHVCVLVRMYREDILMFEANGVNIILQKTETHLVHMPFLFISEV